MTQQPLSQPPSAMRMAWFVTLLFAGLVACQEETGPVNKPAVQPTPAPGISKTIPPETNMPSKEPSPPSEHPRMITGEVVSIDGNNYVVKDSTNKEVRVEANSMTLVDEGIEVGDKAEIRYSVDEKPTAIRKVRGN